MEQSEIKRKLATIMVADIVGFSRLAAQDEDWTIRSLGEFRAIVDEIIARHDGRIFNTGGDSVLAEFASPVEAVRCAVDFQEAARSRNLLQPRDRQLRFRIGLNLGDVMIRGNDLLGDGVNVAARLEGLSEPGGICVSGTVWDHINGKLSLGYVDIGEQVVKNIPRPVRAYRLRVDGGDDEKPTPEAPRSSAAPPSAPAPAPRRGIPVPVALAALIVLIAAAGVFAWQFWPTHRLALNASPALSETLSARLAAIVPTMAEAAREAAARAYLSAPVHKAGAASVEPPGHWDVWDRPTAASAEEAVLESCQVFFGQPCVLLAVDNTVEPVPADGHWPRHDMPRARYAGDFAPAQLPGLIAAVRTRDDIARYRSEPAPKAAAFHPSGVGRVFVSTGQSTQRAAEEKALKNCNDDVRNGTLGSCFLYAVGNRVVLPLRLREPMTAPPAQTPAPTPAVAGPAAPAPSATAAVPAPPAAVAPPRPSARRPGETFRDCANCPEMTVLPAGQFMMGEASGEVGRLSIPPAVADRGQPQHQVTIAKPFALAKFPIARGEFAAFAKATNFKSIKGCAVLVANNGWVPREELSWESPGFAQTDRDPVVCMNRVEINAFLDWLRAESGHAYRLPSEAEWEYAARAGTTTAFYWGDDPNQACAYENVFDESAREKTRTAPFIACRDGYADTAPVASFKPNPFGLYDMLGNAMQHTQDCWNDTYAGAPSDGSAWTSGECGRVALRGGSFAAGRPFMFRSAQRLPDGLVARRDRVGFRVALSLP